LEGKKGKGGKKRVRYKSAQLEDFLLFTEGDLPFRLGKVQSHPLVSREETVFVVRRRRLTIFLAVSGTPASGSRDEREKEAGRVKQKSGRKRSREKGEGYFYWP